MGDVPTEEGLWSSYSRYAARRSLGTALAYAVGGA